MGAARAGDQLFVTRHKCLVMSIKSNRYASVSKRAGSGVRLTAIRPVIDW
jgi:hypothetical protein